VYSKSGKSRVIMEEEKKKVVEGKEVIPLLTPYNMGKFNLSHR